MNKYQKALDELLAFPKWQHGTRELFEENRVALQELIDKETPIKPKKLENGKYSCDSCAMAFTVKYLKNRFISHTYCDVCGQKLDWSEE